MTRFLPIFNGLRALLLHNRDRHGRCEASKMEEQKMNMPKTLIALTT